MDRILIVDDEEVILNGLSSALYMLCDYRGEIKAVSSGREAIRELNQGYYDSCFLDIRLGNACGFEIMREIKEVSPETSIVLMSACNKWKVIDEIVKNKEAFFVDKPFDFGRIRSILEQILEGGSDVCAETGNRTWERRIERRRMDRVISFCVKGFDLVSLKGCITDISSTGIGMWAHYPLEEGEVLHVMNGLRHKKGRVVWSHELSEDHYRVGVKYI